MRTATSCAPTEYDILARESDSGVLKGASIPFLMPPIKARATSFSLLGISVGNVLARLLQCGLFLGVEVFECESLLRFELRDRFARIDGNRGRQRDAFLHRPMGLARLLEGRPSSW